MKKIEFISSKHVLSFEEPLIGDYWEALEEAAKFGGRLLNIKDAMIIEHLEMFDKIGLKEKNDYGSWLEENYEDGALYLSLRDDSLVVKTYCTTSRRMFFIVVED